MPSRNSRYKKILFEEHMLIERTSKSRILSVIIEVTGPVHDDPKDLEMINFAYDILKMRIMNEGWAPTGKSLRHIGFDQLPKLGTPAKEEGNLIGWIVEAESALNKWPNPVTQRGSNQDCFAIEMIFVAGPWRTNTPELLSFSLSGDTIIVTPKHFF